MPNTFWRGYECDILSLSKGETVFEYEIKISRADFLKDFKKGVYNNEFFVDSGWKKTPIELKHQTTRSHYFYYVCPVGLISPEEIPEKYGLIYYHENTRTAFNALKIIKKAKMIKADKPTHDEIIGLFNLSKYKNQFYS